MTGVSLLVYGSTREARRLVQRALADAGYRVRLASSMAEAAKCLAAGDVRAIVLADAQTAADSERGAERLASRERGIPVIGAANDNGSLWTDMTVNALLDAIRDALAAPPR